jgi:hypothetical protein
MAAQARTGAPPKIGRTGSSMKEILVDHAPFEARMPPGPHSATERRMVTAESFHGVGRSRLVNARFGVGADAVPPRGVGPPVGVSAGPRRGLTHERQVR